MVDDEHDPERAAIQLALGRALVSENTKFALPEFERLEGWLPGEIITTGFVWSTVHE